ncbi:cytokinin riboside 5'-monophosphate phosphoribohydrolase [Citrus sinensis]|uniref:Cytokinin riboside 5'-monophosphate phosphoribohydrolase n=2 Tax=Citrus sinensis TaxID=2711 RepID=A0ACB8M6N3_CITSI|nr:cytokinin riboside 5'-monophosphate phosphoribohydrolase [Citrus sinensis]KAH9781482.1 cytokinin riboside 5'-monophosphate phosphoribohydrolase [Citrus sinensis]
MAATSSSQLKNICVLSGFRYGKYKEFVQAAIDLDRAIAERKLHLVYGGGDRGLSKLVSEAAFIRGSQVLGIIPKALKPFRCLLDSPTGEELVVSGMQEKISEMLNHADAFIFLPGDLATLEVLITFASWAHLNIHQKPIAKKLFICAPTAKELLDLLQAYKPEPDPMTLALDWATDDDGSNSRKKCKSDLTLRL